MVEFAWSWKDYERCKRAEERKAAMKRAIEQGSPDPALQLQVMPDSAPPVIVGQVAPAAAPEPEPEPEPSLAEQLQSCGVCFKKRLNPCLFAGCPIL